MKYILQVKEPNEPKWVDMDSSEDETVIEEAAKVKANDFPLKRLRIVKEVATQVNFDVKIID